MLNKALERMARKQNSIAAEPPELSSACMSRGASRYCRNTEVVPVLTNPDGPSKMGAGACQGALV
jgi:hypothetical protein